MDDSNYNDQGQIATTPYASPFHQLGSTILLLTNPEDEIHKLELTLRNAYEDENGNVTTRTKMVNGYRVPIKPLLNDEGVAAVIGQVQTVVSRVTVLSNLDDEIIGKIGNNFCNTMSELLGFNAYRFDIATLSDRDAIFDASIVQVLICMRRAHDEGERRFLKGSTQEMTMRSEGGHQKQGALSRFLGWGGGK